MFDVVVVLAYWRPDYIARCLECLTEAKAHQKIWVFQDDRIDLPKDKRDAHSLTRDIISQNSDKWDRFIQRVPHDFTTHGQDGLHCCSYNSFWGLREAYEFGSNLTYLVADDVLVTPDFFKWHEAVHKDDTWFSSVAERPFKQFQWWDNPFNLSAYYMSPTILMDGGMCWPRRSLKTVLRYPMTEVRDHRFNYDGIFPVIPAVQRAYHVGRKSSYLYGDGVCGDTDSDPITMPVYEWDSVYFDENFEEPPCQPTAK